MSTQMERIKAVLESISNRDNNNTRKAAQLERIRAIVDEVPNIITDEERTLVRLLGHLGQAQKIVARHARKNEDMRLIEGRLLIMEDEMRLQIHNLRKERGGPQ